MDHAQTVSLTARSPWLRALPWLILGGLASALCFFYPVPGGFLFAVGIAVALLYGWFRSYGRGRLLVWEWAALLAVGWLVLSLNPQWWIKPLWIVLSVLWMPAAIAVYRPRWLRPLASRKAVRILVSLPFPLSGLSLLLLMPLLSLLLFFGAQGVASKVDQWAYTQSREFDAARWQAGHLKYRFSVLNHVASDIILPGMTAKEVEALLGKPEKIAEGPTWHYKSKRPGWRFIDFSGGGLAVRFGEDHRVSEAVNDSWID